MTESQTDLMTYLDANDLAANIFQYRTSPLDPVTKDSITTLFSNERRRLTQDEKRFQLYDENGSLYVDKVPFDEFYKKIIEIQKDGLPEPDDTDYAINWEMIMGLIGYLQKNNYSVWGNNQKGYDNWDVLNDDFLNRALHQAQETGEPQLLLSQNDDDNTYLVDRDDNKILIRNYQEYNLSEQDYSDYYEVRTPEGAVVVNNIPRRRLGLVLLAIVDGFNAEQVKSQFIWPKLSNDLVGDSRLLFERSFCSEPIEIKTLADSKATEELPILEDENHIVNKYRFIGDEANWTWKLAFSDEDLPEVIDYLYHDLPIDVKDAGQTLSDFLVDLGEHANKLVLRQQQSLLNSGVVNQLLIDDDGGFKVGASKNSSNVNFVTSVFTVADKDTMRIEKSELSIDELVAYLWRIGK